ncbi:hypothetical protein KXV85_004882, partial [Aspergillus fumigatus]
TPRGEGTGIVHFENGKISGGDSIMTYGGFYEVSGDRFTATVTITRHTAGHATVFGIDDLVLKLGGVSKGAIATCTGTADVEPGLTFEATLIRCRSDPSNARTDLPPPKFDPASGWRSPSAAILQRLLPSHAHGANSAQGSLSLTMHLVL